MNQVAVQVHDSHLSIVKEHHKIAVVEVLQKLISLLSTNTVPEFLVNTDKNPSFTRHRTCIHKGSECGLEVANNFQQLNIKLIQLGRCGYVMNF